MAKKFFTPLVVILLLAIQGFSQYGADRELRRLRDNLVQTKDTAHITALLDLSWYYMNSQADTARLYAWRAVRESIAIKDKVRQIKSENALGVTYIMVGDYSNGIAHNIKALELAQEINYKKAYPSLLHNIGYDYFTQGENEKALEYLKKAAFWSEELGDSSMMISALAGTGEVLAIVGDFPAAISNINKALQYYVKVNDTDSKALCYSHLGKAYYGLKEYEKSLLAFRQSLELRHSTNEYGKVVCYLGFIQNYVPLQRYEDALLYSDTVERISKRNKFLQELSEMESLRSQTYEAMNEHGRALSAYKKHIVYRDSIFNIKKASEIQRLQIGFDTNQKEIQMENLMREKKYEQTLMFVYLALGICIIGVLTLVIYHVLRQHRLVRIQHQIDTQRNLIEQQRITLENQQLQQQEERISIERDRLNLTLEEKQRELLTNSMNLQQQKDFLNSLHEELSQLRSPAHPELSLAISRLEKSIKIKIDQSDGWEDIRMHFDKIHPDFFNRLKQNNPDLTTMDLKLCAYIKMNLSNKEISKILNINPSSVQVSKYRLKRKLRLDENLSLTDVLLSI